MTAIDGFDRKHQEDLDLLKIFRLIDDDFFTKCFEGGVELVLRLVLDMPDLEITSVRVQVFVANLLNHSVRLDMLAADGKGRKFNIEIQRSDKGAGRKRVRFISSILDAKYLPRGEDFDELPETYLTFITEHNVLKKRWPVYHRIERCIMGANEH